MANPHARAGNSHQTRRGRHHWSNHGEEVLRGHTLVGMRVASHSPPRGPHQTINRAERRVAMAINSPHKTSQAGVDRNQREGEWPRHHSVTARPSPITASNPRLPRKIRPCVVDSRRGCHSLRSRRLAFPAMSSTAAGSCPPYGLIHTAASAATSPHSKCRARCSVWYRWLLASEWSPGEVRQRVHQAQPVATSSHSQPITKEPWRLAHSTKIAASEPGTTVPFRGGFRRQSQARDKAAHRLPASCGRMTCS
jgi:hypothetical protein